MADALKLVQSVTVGAGGSASIDFTSIPQTGTDLMLICSIRGNTYTYAGALNVQFNGDTASNYIGRVLYGDGASTATRSDAGGTSVGAYSGGQGTINSNIFGNTTFYVPNYTSSETKLVRVDYVTESPDATAFAGIVAGKWTGTTAISSIKVLVPGQSFVENSKISLYTITKF